MKTLHLHLTPSSIIQPRKCKHCDLNLHDHHSRLSLLILIRLKAVIIMLLATLNVFVSSSMQGNTAMKNMHTVDFDRLAARIMQQPHSINLSSNLSSKSSSSSYLSMFRPFARERERERDLQIQQNGQQNLHPQSKTQPIRIQFVTSPIEDTIAESTSAEEKAGGDLILNTILPTVQQQFAEIINVQARSGTSDDSISFPDQVCSSIYKEYLDPTNIVGNADMVIFVSAYTTVVDDRGDEITWCNPDPSRTTLAVSTFCAKDDATDRPLIGLLNICLAATTYQSTSNMEEIIAHELLHTLVMSEYLIPFFRSAIDGSRFISNPYIAKQIPCVNGNDNAAEKYNDFYKISSKVLQYKTENIKYSDGYVKRGYYEIVLPTVRQVVRNQFNCQSMTGARLENQPTNPHSCIGSHFDERFFQYHTMSALYDSTSDYFNPLTLALLEDSGWYGVNFRNAKNSPFGISAGCDFVNKDCVVDGKLPDYSKGNFCNVLQSSGHWMCDPGHNFRAGCDLYNYLSYQTDQVKPGRQYFPNSFLGPIAMVKGDWCPTVYKFTDMSAECTSKTAEKIDDLEVFGDSSRCLAVSIDGADMPSSLCLDAFCDDEQKQFVFDVGGTNYACGIGDDFKDIDVVSSERILRFTCPKLAQACPE